MTSTPIIIRPGELAVDVVVVGVGPFALGDGEDLVEIAVAVGPVALLDETARRVVGVARRHAVGGGRDELVRAVESEGSSLVAHGPLHHVAGLVVDVTFDVRAVLLHREELTENVLHSNTVHRSP